MANERTDPNFGSMLAALDGQTVLTKPRVSREVK